MKTGFFSMNGKAHRNGRWPCVGVTILWFLCILVQGAVPAAEPAKTKAPAAPKYRLEVVSVHQAKPPEQMLVLLHQGGGVAFKSTADLQGYLGNLARGSSIEWAPSCVKDSPGELLSTAAELKSLTEHCAKHGIVFTRIPSG